MMSHPDAVAQRETKTVSFVSGEVEKTLIALGFDQQKLRDDGYLSKAIDDCGGTDGFKALAEHHEQLVALSRPKLMAECFCRMTGKEWIDYKSLALTMDAPDLIRDVLLLERRRVAGFWVAQVSGM